MKIRIHTLNLKNKLTVPDIFKKHTPKNIKINAFRTCVVHLWFANTYVQFT